VRFHPAGGRGLAGEELEVWDYSIGYDGKFKVQTRARAFL
jgi:hypothetical protein